MDNNLDEALREFLTESQENLDQMDQDLVTLGDAAGDRETVARIFRTVHTIKGTCGFLGLPKLGDVAHAGENLLCRLRDGQIAWSSGVTDALLALSGALRNILNWVASGGGEGDADFSDLVRRLGAFAAGETPSARSEGAAPAAPAAAQSPEAAPDEAAQAAASSSVRVDVVLLDRLMNLVGELVLARNQLIQHTASRNDPALLSSSQRMSLITTELQEEVMKTRMQPISNLWNKIPRVVRDLARSCGKQAHVEVIGSETELDRTILEAIKDPLTHLVRNAVDHGIEAPEVRRERGKPAAGRLRLRAFHESGQVNVEISDDGAGIDPERVVRRAVESGLVSREQVARMSDRERLDLIFLPGLSTAERVTSISGRGVGMDVVRTNIERLGGTIEIQSRPGLGATFKIKLPLTLAIVPALVVTTRGDRYAIPQVNLLELVRLEGDQYRSGIEMIRGAPILRLRGELLPLVYLDRALGLEPAGGREQSANIVVLHTDGRRFGLVVDDVSDTEEIVVKPLGKLFKGIPLYAGATIMGDGRVALILDVHGVAQLAGLSEVAVERAAGDKTDAARGADERRSYLLFRQGADRRMAIPMSQVARLEEIPASSIEQADDREVVQYRKRILPLLRLSNVFHTDQGGGPADGTMHVIVYDAGGVNVGLVVDEILDVVEGPPRLERASRGRGVFATAVIQGRVTEMIDPTGLIRTFDPDLFAATAPEAVGA
jgi:two-component system chemotaxis sensor kinase CheA